MRKFCPCKVGIQQCKGSIPPCQDETFYMQSQDKICEGFITPTGSWENRTEFHLVQPGSSHHHLNVFIFSALLFFFNRDSTRVVRFRHRKKLCSQILPNFHPCTVGSHRLLIAIFIDCLVQKILFAFFINQTRFLLTTALAIALIKLLVMAKVLV